jgi:hypothetical protein
LLESREAPQARSGINAELGRDRDLVAMVASKATDLSLGGAKTIHSCKVEMTDAVLERARQQPFSRARRGNAHQTRAAKADP